jgi:hypothetical protein
MVIVSSEARERRNLNTMGQNLHCQDEDMKTSFGFSNLSFFPSFEPKRLVTPVCLVLPTLNHIKTNETSRNGNQDLPFATCRSKNQDPPQASCGSSLCSTLSSAGAASTSPTSTLDTALPLDEHGEYHIFSMTF